MSRANQFDPVNSNNSTTLTGTVVAAAVPSIKLSMTETGQVVPVATGQSIVFAMTVTNAGPNAATNVVLQETLPANVTYYASAPSQGLAPSIINGQVAEDLGTIAPGASATFYLQVIPKLPRPLHQLRRGQQLRPPLRPHGLRDLLDPDPFGPQRHRRGRPQ